MATVEQRYSDAVAYVERAIATVEKQSSSWNPITLAIESYAGKTKTEPVRNELRHIQDRWKAATNDVESARVARDAELLADRTQENLPGAPQDRKRTNLYKGETPASTPATSFGQEASNQATHVVRWAQQKAHAVAQKLDEPWPVARLLLIGGGVVLTLALLGSSDRQQRQARARVLNRRLAQIANDHGEAS